MVPVVVVVARVGVVVGKLDGLVEHRFLLVTTLAQILRK